MLDDLALIHRRDSADMLGIATRRWATVRESARWRVDSPVRDNRAKQLALELLGKTVVVYGSGDLFEVAQMWKLYINTNAHQLAWVGGLDDADVLGWTGQPISKQYALVELRGDTRDSSESRWFDTVDRALSGRRPAPQTVEAPIGDQEYRAAHHKALGEFVSLYLAVLSGVDPAKQDIIEKIKRPDRYER